MILQPQITRPIPILQPIVNFSKILFWISKHTLSLTIPRMFAGIHHFHEKNKDKAFAGPAAVGGFAPGPPSGTFASGMGFFRPPQNQPHGRVHVAA